MQSTCHCDDCHDSYSHVNVTSLLFVTTVMCVSMGVYRYHYYHMYAYVCISQVVYRLTARTAQVIQVLSLLYGLPGVGGWCDL